MAQNKKLLIGLGIGAVALWAISRNGGQGAGLGGGGGGMGSDTGSGTVPVPDGTQDPNAYCAAMGATYDPAQNACILTKNADPNQQPQDQQKLAQTQSAAISDCLGKGGNPVILPDGTVYCQLPGGPTGPGGAGSTMPACPVGYTRDPVTGQCLPSQATPDYPSTPWYENPLFLTTVGAVGGAYAFKYALGGNKSGPAMVDENGMPTTIKELDAQATRPRYNYPEEPAVTTQFDAATRPTTTGEVRAPTQSDVIDVYNPRTASFEPSKVSYNAGEVKLPGETFHPADIIPGKTPVNVYEAPVRSTMELRLPATPRAATPRAMAEPPRIIEVYRPPVPETFMGVRAPSGAGLAFAGIFAAQAAANLPAGVRTEQQLASQGYGQGTQLAGGIARTFFGLTPESVQQFRDTQYARGGNAATVTIQQTAAVLGGFDAQRGAQIADYWTTAPKGSNIVEQGAYAIGGTAIASGQLVGESAYNLGKGAVDLGGGAVNTVKSWFGW